MRWFGFLLVQTVGLLAGGCASQTALHVYSNPTGAGFEMGSSGLVGRTDARIIIPKSYFSPDKTYNDELVLFKEGYRKKEVPVPIHRDEENFTSPPVIELEPLDTTLTVLSTPLGARVSFNLRETDLPEGWRQSFVTSSPVLFGATRREAEALRGQLQFTELTLPGHAAVNYRSGDPVPLRPGENYELNILFESSITTLHVLTVPPGAFVEIGGRLVGETPLTRDFGLNELPLWGTVQDETVTMNLVCKRAGVYEIIKKETIQLPIGHRTAVVYLLPRPEAYVFTSEPDGVTVSLQRPGQSDWDPLDTTPFTEMIVPPLQPGDKLKWAKTKYETEIDTIVSPTRREYRWVMQEVRPPERLRDDE